ncbi:hypothetical protein ACIBIZ_40120 [Nonomuraea spiralis]
MNIEVEILDLQLRIQALEARSCSESSNALLAGIATVRADVADVHSEVGQDFEILNFEIARLRWTLDDNCRSSLAEVLRRLDELQCQLVDLGLRLDRLLAKDDL